MKTIKTPKAKASKPTKAVEKIEASPAREKSVVIAPAVAPAALTAPRREITTELIAARAYSLWEQQGCPQGNEVQNWLLAESQLKQEVHSFTA